MAATCAESLVKEGVAPVHPYYSLLPSYVTLESVQEEREDFLRRIQVSCAKGVRECGAQTN